jgi:hypothetical protein
VPTLAAAIVDVFSVSNVALVVPDGFAPTAPPAT